MNLLINFPPPQILEKSVDNSDPLKPVAKIRVKWAPTGNRSTVSIWQVHPDGWNYSDDHAAGSTLECRDLKHILWNYGLSDADANIQAWIEKHAEQKEESC